MPTGSEHLSATTALGPTSRREVIAPSRSPSARTSTVRATWSNGSFNKIKHCRRVATRYDELAANYLAFVQLASIRLWLQAGRKRDSWPRAYRSGLLHADSA